MNSTSILDWTALAFLIGVIVLALSGNATPVTLPVLMLGLLAVWEALARMNHKIRALQARLEHLDNYNRWITEMVEREKARNSMTEQPSDTLRDTDGET